MVTVPFAIEIKVAVLLYVVTISPFTTILRMVAPFT